MRIGSLKMEEPRVGPAPSEAGQQHAALEPQFFMQLNERNSTALLFSIIKTKRTGFIYHQPVLGGACTEKKVT